MRLLTRLLFVGVCLALPSRLSAQEPAAEESIRFPVEMEEFQLTVLDGDRKPISGVEVQVNGVRCEEDPGSWYAWPSANAGPKPTVVSDEVGQVSFEFPKKFGMAGIYRTITTLTLNFRHADYISERAETPIEEQAFEQILKSGCRVTYSAADAEGQPIEKFGAFISGPGYDAKWNLEDGTIQSSAVPDGAWQTMLVAPREDGVTLFSGVLPARYASGKDVTIRNITVRPGLRLKGELSADVPRPVKDGVVISWSQPKPTETQLKNREAIGWSDMAVIEEDGSFEFSSLPRSGRVQLIAVCRGWVVEDQPREGQPAGRGSIKSGVLLDLETASIEDGVLADVILPMEAAGVIEVVVKHLDGRPAEGISVGTSPNQKLEDTGTQLLGEGFPSVRLIEARLDDTVEIPDFWQTERSTRYMQVTDEDGKATLHDLPVGIWDVFVGSEKFLLVTEGPPDSPYPMVSVTLDKPDTVQLNATVKPVEE